ncbi:hypothetical protein CHH83_03370 [Bacillus sp. 7586-K]|nr:hypothetical protein CHH83_03370 [Bacillus sp. 7586-K]
MSIEAFEYIKYIFIFLIIVLVAIVILTVILKKKSKNFINWFTLASIPVISIIVSALLLIFVGYAADEINFEASPFVIMFIIILLISVINFFLAYRQSTNSK